MLIPCSTVVSIAASWATAPSEVRGKPAGTEAGPCRVDAGMVIVGPATAAGVETRLSAGPTASMGADSIWSRRAAPPAAWGPGPGAGWAAAVAGTALAVPVADVSAK